MSLARAFAVISGAWLAFLVPLAAQQPDTGSIVGRVISTDTGAGVSGAAIRIEGAGVSATSDLDGNFRLSGVPAGTHALIVSRLPFRDSNVTGVVVTAGATVSANVPMESSLAMPGEVVHMEAFVVQSTAAEGSGLTLLADRQKAPAISDAIGEDTISRLDVGDAAGAMGKVTGASVVDGKYVLIRGLGDRYSNTLLNNVTVPSADPDRRAVQMDQFPASLLESIVTSKSFTPDQAGGFTGGSVNMRTKSFPERFFASFGVSVSMNTNVDGEETLAVPGGGRDWLGRDDGTRAIPDGIPAIIPTATAARLQYQAGNPAPALELDRVSHAFHNDTYLPHTEKGGADFGFNFATGNRHEFSQDRMLGYVLSLTYQDSTNHYTDGYASRYSQGAIDATSPTFADGLLVYSPDVADFSFATAYAANPNIPVGAPHFGATRTSQNVDWGSFAQVAFKPSLNHEFTFRYLHNQSASDQVMRGVGESTRSDGGRLFTIYDLLYTERSIDSLQLSGESLFPQWKDVRVEWRAAHSDSRQEQPDYRSLSYFWDFGAQQFAIAAGSGNNRAFRDLQEDSDEIAADVFVPFYFRERPATVKFGGVWQDGGRVYRERIFRWSQPLTTTDAILNFPAPVGIVSQTATTVTFGNTISELGNRLVNFDGAQSISAGYVMADIAPWDRWRAVFGVRAEHTEISTAPAPGGTNFQAAAIDQTDLLPALSVVYQLRSDMNLRAAYGRTLARPLYRELADVRIENYFRDKVFTGNPNLEVTTVNNFDLRWEWFRRPTEVIAVSAFYKDFSKPIEVLEDATIGSEQPRNLENGKLYGLEFEARIGLEEFNERLAGFSIGGNLSLIKSAVSIPAAELAVTRMSFPDADDTRELFGQSPYIVNLDVSYTHQRWGTSASLAYNIAGERLSLVTSDALPEIYEQPAPTLDLVVSQRLWGNWRFKFTAKNLLDPEHEKSFSHRGTDYYYERYQTGRSFGLGLSCLFE